MRVISRKTLKDFWLQTAHRDAEIPLRYWYKEASSALWHDPHEIKRRYPHSSILPGGRVVFNIGGNKYRLVVVIRYDLGLVFIRFIGNHAEYDGIDAGSI